MIGLILDKPRSACSWSGGFFLGDLLFSPCLIIDYRNDPKFSDRQFWANSADPDQTAPRGAV